jgi:hypothetical protein
MKTSPIMHQQISIKQLTGAFPTRFANEAKLACTEVAQRLHEVQWTDFISFSVEGETVTIPYGIRFAEEPSKLSVGSVAWLMARALQSRSTDGYQRQRAVQDIMKDLKPWTAQFVLPLIGSYVEQILIDIDTLLTPQSSCLLATHIQANPQYWEITKQRVWSYFDVYYKHNKSKKDYIGFRLIERLEVDLKSNKGSIQT